MAKGSKRFGGTEKEWRGRSYRKGEAADSRRSHESGGTRRAKLTIRQLREKAYRDADRRESRKNPSFRKGDKITFPGDHGVRVAGRFLGMEDVLRGVAAVCGEDTYKLLEDSPESGEAYTHYVDLGDIRPRVKSSASRAKSTRSSKVSGGKIQHVNGRYEVGGGKWFGTKAKAEAYLRKHG